MSEKLGHREHIGNKTHTKQSTILTYRPLPEGASSHRRNIKWGEGAGRQSLPSTREATKEGGAREETGETRSKRRTARPRPQPCQPMVEPTEGGGMAADSRGPNNGGGAGGGGARDGEPTSQGDAEDPGGQGGAEGSGGGDGTPEIHAGATEDPGGADGRKEPNGAGGMERR